MQTNHIFNSRKLRFQVGTAERETAQQASNQGLHVNLRLAQEVRSSLLLCVGRVPIPPLLLKTFGTPHGLMNFVSDVRTFNWTLSVLSVLSSYAALQPQPVTHHPCPSHPTSMSGWRGSLHGLHLDVHAAVEPSCRQRSEPDGKN